MNIMDRMKYESIPLDEWVKMHSSEEELRSVFLNLDRALKYIHDHNYCIEVFYPSQIEILNNEVDHIQFKRLLQLPDDISLKRQMIKEDIFNSTFIQIGIYTNSLKYLSPDFLKENFDSFIQFLPNGDVPYYRGVVQRGASVYFCEYALEKRNRDLEELERQVGDDSSPIDKQVLNQDNSSLTNDEINRKIYSQINGLKDAAFVHILILPTIVLGFLFIFILMAWIISMISI